MSVTSQIVTVNAVVTPAPVPSDLQRRGALVSFGGTTASTSTYTFYPTLAAVTAALSGAGNHTELSHMATTFFAQSNAGNPAIGVYIIELGVQADVTIQITDLQTWIAANPDTIYAYLVPAAWDTEASDFETMAATFGSPTGRQYFFATVASGSLSSYTTKAICAVVNSPTAAGTEFQAASLFYQYIVNNPSPSSPIAPMQFRFLFGVTPWDPSGNQATITTILTANGNIVYEAAEGGLSDAAIYRGKFMDGTQMMFWWAVDWLQIQTKLGLANAVIIGSNQNPPLYYNQNGINRLLAKLQTIGKQGQQDGVLLEITFDSIAFADYIAANPDDYAAGNYAGFSATTTPQLGFQTITFNIDALQFV